MNIYTGQFITIHNTSDQVLWSGYVEAVEAINPLHRGTKQFALWMWYKNVFGEWQEGYYIIYPEVDDIEVHIDVDLAD